MTFGISSGQGNESTGTRTTEITLYGLKNVLFSYLEYIIIIIIIIILNICTPSLSLELRGTPFHSFLLALAFNYKPIICLVAKQ